MLMKYLAHPLTRGWDIDAPETTCLRKRIICEKPFLRRIYEEWYRTIVSDLPQGDGGVLELGSGAGFMSEYIPDLITSDILPLPGVSLQVDAHQMPFSDGALRGIVMTNVFHHLGNPRRFLEEAARCVRVGGAIVMVEPWLSTWSKLIYTRLHHEPFDPEAGDWEFPVSGPLSDANGALPWIVFQRDRARFEKEFPQWRVQAIVPCMPFRYLVSGGISLRSLAPAFTFGAWRWLEQLLSRWMTHWAMFARIVIVRTAPVQGARLKAA